MRVGLLEIAAGDGVNLHSFRKSVKVLAFGIATITIGAIPPFY
jgi:uncharacterized protein YqjF (DUF2071 family)